MALLDGEGRGSVRKTTAESFVVVVAKSIVVFVAILA